MDFYTWPANLIEESYILNQLSSSNKLKNAVVKFNFFDKFDVDHSSNDDESWKLLKRKCLYLDNGCVYEATFTNNKSENGLAEHPLANEETEKENANRSEESPDREPVSLVYTPLAKFHVLSLHCGYGVFGAITSSFGAVHAYVWGNSEKGQCGILATVVEKPRRICLKSAEMICEHGFREPGREVPVVSLSFGKTYCLAISSDGSLWSWGAVSIKDSPQLEPCRVGTLYGRRVLSVACGEEHYLALVASENRTSLASSSPELNLLNYVDSCAKCRELRARLDRNLDDGVDDDEERFRYESTEVNFDDSTIFCPLGLRLELSLASSPPNERVEDSGFKEQFTFDDSTSMVSTTKKKRNFSKKQIEKCSMSMAGDVGGSPQSGSLSRQRCRERGDIELTEMRKTKSVGTRFSFTSFEFHAVDASSSSESSGGGGVGGVGSRIIKTESGTLTNGDEDGFSLSSLSTTASLFRTKFGRRKSKENVGRVSTTPVATEVWSWGDNSQGQLGLTDLISRSEPTRVDKLKDACIVRIDAGAFHSLALSSIGEVWTWGSSVYGQIKQVNVTVQPSPTVMKVGSQSCVLDCTAGPDFTILLVNGLDYRTDIYYCGRDHGIFGQNADNAAGSGVALRLSSVNKDRWPICLNSSDDLIVASTRDCRRSPALQRILELVCSEIKFAYKLKKLHTFAMELFHHSSTWHNEDGSLLQAYAEALERFFAVVLQGASSMKSELCEMVDPLTASKFFCIVLSSAYGTTLIRLHSVYCQMMAFNVFSNFNFTPSLEKSLLDLSVANEIESSKPYRILRKLYYLPFARLEEYCKLAKVVMEDQNKKSTHEEHDRLAQFVKHVTTSEQLLLNHYRLAENTGHFWSRCIGKNAVQLSLKLANRFLIKEFSKANGVSNLLENGTSVSWQQVLVFSDSVAFVLKHSNKLLELPLVWIVPLDSDFKFCVQLVAPEAVWTVELIDGVAKNDFVQCCNQAIMRHMNGHYTEWIPGGSPPIQRVAQYKFSSKHNFYGDAFYHGCWASGKPHGRGEMTWINGRFFRGKFKNGYMHGLGEFRVTEINGGHTLTKGHWKEGNLTGLAVIEQANGSEYKGYLKNGLRCGHGVLKQRNTLYVGAWNNDTRHGYGVLDKGKEKYLGMWETDVECGLGTLVTLEGDYCEGTFDRGVFLKGKMITTDGTKYEGDFNGIGILNGKGTIHFANGDTVNGLLHGGVNDQVKITNGIYKKCSDNVTTPINNTWLDSTSPFQDQPALPAEQKWTDIFGHVYENLGIDPHGQSINEGRYWENVVATLERLKAFFNKSEYSNGAVIEKVPNWNRELDDTYLKMVFEYCTKAFAVPYHPFGRLLSGLTDVFNACYSGVGADAKLLPHAIAEIVSVVRRMYQVVRHLFPSLPPECQMDYLIADGIKSSNNIDDYETYGSLFYDSFLQLIHPNLFTLYVLRNESLDRVYWGKINNLNLKNDVALLDFLGVSKALWPIELKNTDVLDTPLVCATAKKKYYADAIYCLQRLSSEFYPSAKLRVIVETFQNIRQCASLATDPEELGPADSWAPVTTYVIVRAQIQRLGAEIELTENFCRQLCSLGEVHYMFTMLQSCYQHIIQNKDLG